MGNKTSTVTQGKASFSFFSPVTSLSDSSLLPVDVDMIQITHKQGLGCSGRHGPKNAATISIFHGKEWSGLQANHQRITNVLV
jgi:hypothetical protein